MISFGREMYTGGGRVNRERTSRVRGKHEHRLINCNQRSPVPGIDRSTGTKGHESVPVRVSPVGPSQSTYLFIFSPGQWTDHSLWFLTVDPPPDSRGGTSQNRGKGI